MQIFECNICIAV